MSEEILNTEEQREADPKNPYKINLSKLAESARYQATDQELADKFGLSLEKLKRNYMPIVDKNRASGREALRIMQFEKAMQGDTRMLIWLGKQYLKQTDDPQFNCNDIVLPWSDDED